MVSENLTSSITEVTPSGRERFDLGFNFKPKHEKSED
jgi:hypothetical protein